MPVQNIFGDGTTYRKMKFKVKQWKAKQVKTCVTQKLKQLSCIAKWASYI